MNHQAFGRVADLIRNTDLKFDMSWPIREEGSEVGGDIIAFAIMLDNSLGWAANPGSGVYFGDRDRLCEFFGITHAELDTMTIMRSSKKGHLIEDIDKEVALEYLDWCANPDVRKLPYWENFLG